ncbi:DUF1399 domain-containing protein [Myroides sp. M-43]|uniref:DUF1399 domain-containing protein n=1 Tax=Myroides oncorhynchi TaxID=2893756 RepID=UPI001E3FECBB|nr:DUF1399 domain-containing protein [Myroides oncorhynchi]MCC9042454.1 DUF1399 domain-containing protein [Myroides oncorhynchi]
MNKVHWKKIEEFQLDKWTDEYGFTLRLAKENKWTKNFTTQAILEYKKFMYLAATSDKMVSPSDVVDVVWHEHLVFTKSYKNFCLILGKTIEHIPSTHNREEYDIFKQAKEHTTLIYSQVFGEQPKEIWEYQSMYDSLHLPKTKYKMSTKLLIGIFVSLAAIPFLHYPLTLIYSNISSSAFLFGLTLIFIGTIAFLNEYNKSVLHDIIRNSSENSFIRNLHPYEMMYLKNKNVKDGIIGTFNELIEQHNIKTGPNYTLELIQDTYIKNREQAYILRKLKQFKTRKFTELIPKLIGRPLFTNQVTTIQGINKYINRSAKFNKLFITNYAILLSIVFFAFMRIITGSERHKPVLFITILTLVIVISSLFFLQRLASESIHKTIIRYYTQRVKFSKLKEDNWQWSYFLTGNAALGAALTTMVILANTPIPHISSSSNNSSCSSDGSSSNSSCGSSNSNSCGSSCGGGGCGGCGGD